MAITEEERELMLQGLVGLRRVRGLLPGNADVDRGIAGINAALGDTVPQRTAARALGISHPALSELISGGELAVKDTARGRAQVVVDSLVEAIESREVAPPEPPAWKQRRAEREAAGEADGRGAELERIIKLRALAFHRALARNLDAAMVESAQRTLAERRESGDLSDEQAAAWENVLDRPISDIAAKITDYSPAGEALRENSPFT